MRILGDSEQDTWGIRLTDRDEAQALLAVHHSPIGEEAMRSTDPAIDFTDRGKRAADKLAYAAIVLPNGIDSLLCRAVVEFTKDESQHLSSLAYAGVRRAQELREAGQPIPFREELLGYMDAKVDEFFGVAYV